MRITLDALCLPGFRAWSDANPQIADGVDLVQVDDSLTKWDMAYIKRDKLGNIETTGTHVVFAARRVTTTAADPAWLS